MTDKRNKLEPERLETLMFLKGSWNAADEFVRSSSNLAKQLDRLV